MIDLNHPHRQCIRRRRGTRIWVRECQCGQRREYLDGIFDGAHGAFSRAWKAAERHLRAETAKSYEFV